MEKIDFLKEIKQNNEIGYIDSIEIAYEKREWIALPVICYNMTILRQKKD